MCWEIIQQVGGGTNRQSEWERERERGSGEDALQSLQHLAPHFTTVSLRADITQYFSVTAFSQTRIGQFLHSTMPIKVSENLFFFPPLHFVLRGASGQLFHLNLCHLSCECVIVLACVPFVCLFRGKICWRWYHKRKSAPLPFRQRKIK